MLKVPPSFKKTNSISDLTDNDFLTGLFGPIDHIEKQPLKTTGFSGSAHEKVVLHPEYGETISLVLKLIYPSQDMTIWRSGNISNPEVMLLDHTEMYGVWNIFQPPYIAYAKENENSALLMHDLSNYLFPDVRNPISHKEEDLLLYHLARMHAHYWQHELLSQPWLAKQDIFFSFLGPHAVAEEKASGREHPIFVPVQEGWDLALQFLPTDLASFLLNPPVEKIMLGLPKTLVHGDSKLANFAILPDEKISAFDWTLIAAAPPACEMGWYISVNASRLARSKEKVLDRYRELLQNELGRLIDNVSWDQMVDAAVLTGAITLLWNKALNLQKNIPGAKEEWNWWLDNIRICKEKY